MYRMLKRNARLALKGNWTPAVLISLTVLLVSVLLGGLEQFAIRMFVEPLAANPTMESLGREGFVEGLRHLFTYAPVEIGITAGFALLSILLLAPLSLGVTYWHYCVVREKNPGYTDCFYFFETGRRYWRSVWYSVLIGVKTFFWAIPFFALPGALFGVSAYYLSLGELLSKAQRASATMGVSLAVALMLLAAVLFMMFIRRYTLAPYLLCEDDGKSARRALRESVRSTKGYRASLFLFALSYIGWMLLTPLTLGFLMLWLMPYMGTGEAMFARYIMEKERLDRQDTEERTREFRPGAEEETASPAAGGVTLHKSEGAERPVFGADGENTPASKPDPYELGCPAAPERPAAPGRVPPPWEAERAAAPPPEPGAAIPWPREGEPVGGSSPAAGPEPSSPLPGPAAPGGDVPPPHREPPLPGPAAPGGETPAQPRSGGAPGQYGQPGASGQEPAGGDSWPGGPLL